MKPILSAIALERTLFRASSRLSYSKLASAKDDGSADIFEGIKDVVEEKSGYKEWLADINQKMAAQPIGPFYLAGSIPFLHNPDFRPQTPITDALRTRMYRLHIGEPDTWTFRKLSGLFKVSIPRIKAVIKLKTDEEKRVAKGNLKINLDYVKKMETMLGAKEPVTVEPEVAPDNLISNRLRPHLVAVPENAQLTPEDAAKILGLKLQSPKTTQPTTADQNAVDTPAAKNGTFIKFDPYEKSRSPFIFVDISSNVRPKQRQVLVRQPNGDLRTGTTQERLRVARRVWGKSANRFID